MTPSPDPSPEMRPQVTSVSNSTPPQKEANRYTISHSDKDYRVDFETGVAPYFGLEPHYTLLELIERVESLLPRIPVAAHQEAAQGLRIPVKSYGFTFLQLLHAP
jgi:hypothetical protein